MKLPFFSILLSCIAVLAYAQYLQHVQGLLPCPLCVAQRLAFGLLGLIALIGFMHAPKNIGRRIYGFLMATVALLGTIVAARHAWLIRYPESFECGISPEEAFLNALPFATWWPGMFEANGDCANVEWRFLALTIPDWSLLTFVSLGAVSVYLLLARNNRTRPF